MLENIYTDTAATPTGILVLVHPHSDSQHYSIPSVARLWPAVSNTSAAAKRTLDTFTSMTAPLHPQLMPLAHISLASADCPHPTRAFWLQIKLPYLFRNPFVKLLHSTNKNLKMPQLAKRVIFEKGKMECTRLHSNTPAC